MTSKLVQQSNIDRSLGVVLLGMAVIGFIVLTIVGMSTIQRSAESLKTTGAPAEEAVIDFED